MMYLRETAMKLHRNKREFRRVFPHLNLEDFWDITGFDIVKFDKAILTPDGVSLKDHVLEHYGQDALSLVENLI